MVKWSQAISLRSKNISPSTGKIVKICCLFITCHSNSLLLMGLWSRYIIWIRHYTHDETSNLQYILIRIRAQLLTQFIIDTLSENILTEMGSSLRYVLSLKRIFCCCLIPANHANKSCITWLSTNVSLRENVVYLNSLWVSMTSQNSWQTFCLLDMTEVLLPYMKLYRKEEMGISMLRERG